jgi:hypothetical protein
VTSTPADSRPRNVPGLVGLVLAIVQTLVAVLQAGLSTAIPILAFQNGLGAGQIGALFSVFGVGQLLLALATALFGVIGVTRTGLPKVPAAIAVGVGGSGVIVGIASLLLPVLVGMTLR